MFNDIRVEEARITEEERVVQRLRWVKNHPARREAVKELLRIGEELAQARSGSEQQLAEARWDRARERLQAVDQELKRRWEILFR
jgi:hypothetical protein